MIKISQRPGKTGRKLADDVLSDHERRCRRFILKARRALVELLHQLEDATTDDLRERLPIPSDIGATTIGAVPRALVKASVIRHVGWRESSRATSHGRHLRSWRLVSREAAASWLAANPLPNDPDVSSPPVQRQLFADAGGVA